MKKLGIIVDSATDDVNFSTAESRFLDAITLSNAVEQQTSGYVYAIETTVMPSQKARNIQIAFENKRLIKDGTYAVFNINDREALIPNSLIKVNNGIGYCLAINFNDKDSVLNSGDKIGAFEQIDDCELIETTVNRDRIPLYVTHELTLTKRNKGKTQHLKREIMATINQIPTYQYRI